MAWTLVPAAFAVWVATDYDRYYVIWDEWVLIDRAQTGFWLREMFIGFNGHLSVLSFWTYATQLGAFGVEQNLPTYFVFAGSLAALQLGVAGVLYRLGVPTAVALAAATVVTYLGRFPENMVWEFQAGTSYAWALCAAAAFVALGKPSRNAAVGVAAILVAAVLTDSSIALVGTVFAGTLIVWLWPRRLAIAALAAPVLAHLAWFAVDRSGVLVKEPCLNCEDFSTPAPIGWSLRFAFHLFAKGAGGLVGGYEAAGVIAFTVATVCVVVGIARHRLPPPVLAAFVGGLLATAATVVSLTRSRAGFWADADEAVANLPSRYVHWVAIPLVLAFVPALVATFRPGTATAGRVLTTVATLALAGIFLWNATEIAPTADFFSGWGDGVKTRVQESVTVLADGCPPGREPDPDAQPVKDLSYQITVGLLQDLLDRGALTPEFGRRPTPETRHVICRAR